MPRSLPPRSSRAGSPVPLVAALAAATLLGGCAGTSMPRTVEASAGVLRACASGFPLADGPARPSASPQGDAAPRADASGTSLSERARDVADAIGALALVARLERAPRDAGGEPTLERLAIRQALLEQVLNATLEVSATVAEIDCEGERGDQLRDRLQTQETRRLRQATLLGMVAGAFTSIVGGGLALASAGNAIVSGLEVLGGAVEAAASGAALTTRAEGELRTARNLLADVWNGPAESAVFRPSVWRYLTQATTLAPPFRTRREALLAEWHAGGRLGPPDSDEARSRTALLFGPGGRFSIEDLEARESMLDLLESTVALMNQDLERLLRELRRMP